jgi:murein L,D-transpeptidase YafK
MLLAACGEAQPEEQATAQARLGAYPDGTETFIRIFKSESELEVWVREPGAATYALAKTFDICSWSGDLGPKLREGDGQSPEGFYRVYEGSLNPNSQFHLSFNLGFPNAYDGAHGRTGSYLMVHGDCVSIGCYAMTDEGIEQIYRRVEKSLSDGQGFVPVHIFPFRMTTENLAVYEEHQWYAFWQNLAEVDGAFRATNLPPKVSIAGKRYILVE